MLLALLFIAAIDYPRAPSIDDAADPFIPLETSDGAPTQDWLAAQARLLAREIDSQPALETYERRIRQIQDQTAYWTALPAAGNRFVLVGSQGATGGSGPAVTIFLREGNEAPRPLLTAATAGGALSRWAAVDRSGRRLAYLVGEPGSRWLRLRVLDIDRGVTMEDDVAGLHSTAPQVAWLPDGSGVVYAHFEPPADPRLGEVPAPRLRLHRLGTPPSADEVLLSPDPGLAVVAHAEGDVRRASRGRGSPGHVRPLRPVDRGHARPFHAVASGDAGRAGFAPRAGNRRQ